MLSHDDHRGIACHRRSGMATLEFVMALPILLLLMVGIVWLGFFVIGQTEVIIEARNKAWKKRFVNEKQVPLMFPTALGDIGNPEYPGNADYVTETSTTKIDVSPVFAMIPGPKSSHTILAGSWDHSAMPMKAPPDWDLVKYALVNSLTGKLQSAASIIQNFDTLLADIVKQAAAEAAASIAGGGFGGGSGSFDNLGSPPESKPDDDRRPPNGEEDRRTQELQQQKAALQEELQQVNQEIEELGDIQANEPKEKLQKRQLLALKKQRIEKNLAYVNKEIGNR